ncbi:MAG: hypothetical protein M1115_05330 [Actinobacteria bacterium]|nr:hypothetical protein [Actinomycetota bacterium]
MTELTVPPGRGATLALFELISKAKAGDQLRPVTVVVPSSYVGLTFRRLLPFLPAGAPYFQDGSSRSGRGLVNVSFLTARHLGDELGLAGLCGDQRAPLTFQVWLAAARSVLADPPASLAEIAEHPSTAEALAHAFSELEGCSLTAVQTLSRRDGRGAAVARSYLETLAMLEPYFYSKRDELGAIGDLVKEEAGRLFLSRTLGQMILFAPGQLSWMERQTMHSLQLASRSTVNPARPRTSNCADRASQRERDPALCAAHCGQRSRPGGSPRLGALAGAFGESRPPPDPTLASRGALSSPWSLRRSFEPPPSLGRHPSLRSGHLDSGQDDGGQLPSRHARSRPWRLEA